MNLSSTLAECSRLLKYPSSPASPTTTRLTAMINECLQEVISEPDLGRWIASHVPPLTIASVANQATYTVPNSVARIDSVTERTNLRKLDMGDLSWYRAVQPDPAITTGVPEKWIPLGYAAVATQPTAATGLWAVSAAAGDTTQTVRVETIRTGGYVYSGSIALNGLTRVALSATVTDHLEVTKFYLSAAAVGAVSLYDAASNGNELARIAVGQTYARYLAFALWPTPAAPVTYYVDGERDLADMSQTTDEAPIPTRLHELLVDGVMARELLGKDDDRAAKYEAKYTKKIARLRYFVTCPPDFLPSRSGQGIERSRFGGQYPADRG